MMKSLHSGRSDARKRTYIAPRRILQESAGCHNTGLLLSGEFQCYGFAGQPLCRIEPGNELLLDFGRELAGGIRIVTSPNEGATSTIRITFGESVSEALGSPDQDHAIHQTTLMLPQSGMTEYGNTGFRFVRLQVDDCAPRPLDLTGVCAVAAWRELEYVGSFHCDDERLNRIWTTGAYTVQLCMQDYLYDGIKRDRMVWIGDLYPEILTVAAAFSDMDAVESSLELVANYTPEGQWFNGISSYSAWWVICHYVWFWKRANLEYLRRHHRTLARLLRQLAACVDTDGVERLPETRFLDWPSRADAVATHVGLQGLLAWCFQCGDILAEILQDEALQTLCSTTRKRLLRAPLPFTVNKSAAAMLAAGGITAPNMSLREVLGQNPERGLSTFFGYFVLEARARSGDLAGAVELIRRYWGAMLDYGATTFWEDFDLEWIRNAGRIDEIPQPGQDDLHADFGKYCYQGLRHSLCHGWAAGPTAFLSEHILGVKALAPGFRRVEISPQFTGVRELTGSVPTPYGPITIEGTPGHFHWDTPDEIEVMVRR